MNMMYYIPKTKQRKRKQFLKFEDKPTTEYNFHKTGDIAT